MFTRSRPSLFHCLTAICLWLSTGSLSALAETYTWTGKGNGQKWSDRLNWSPNGVPADGDEADIGSAAENYTVKVDGAFTIGNLTVINSTVAGSGSLNVTGSVRAQSATFAPGGGMVINGLRTDLLDRLNRITEFNCPVTINGGSLINTNSILSVGAPVTAVNNGLMTLYPGAQINLNVGPGATFINKNAIQTVTDFRATNNVLISTGSSIFSNAPAATLQVGDTTLDIEGTFANSGILEGAELGAGSFNIGAIALLYDGAQLKRGTHQFTSRMSINGHVTVSGQVLMNVYNCTNNGLLEVTGYLTWQAGTIFAGRPDAPGYIVNRGQMIVDQKSGGFLALQNITITNQASLILTNLGTLFAGYNTWIQNIDAGELVFAGNGSLVPNSNGSKDYDKALVTGTVVKIAGRSDGEAWIAFPLSKSDVTVLDGTLRLTGGGTFNHLRSAGTLRLAAGTFTALTDGSVGPAGPNLLNRGKVVLTQPAALVIADDFDILNGGILEQDSGTQISGHYQIAIAGRFDWEGGTYLGGVLLVTDKGVLNFVGNGTRYFRSGSIGNSGTMNWNEDNDLGGIELSDNTRIDNSGNFNIYTDAVLADVSTNKLPLFTNAQGGVVTKFGSTGSTFISVPFHNDGSLVAKAGTLELQVFDDNPPSAVGAAVDEISLGGGTIKFHRANVVHAYLSGKGTILLEDPLIWGGNMNEDLVEVVGDLTNEGSVSLGDAPGLLNYIRGTFTQHASGVLIVPIRGTNAVAPDFGQLKADPQFGYVNLNGTLQVELADGFAPAVGMRFPIISSAQRTGTFSKVLLPGGMTLEYTAGGANIIVTGTVPVQLVAPASLAGVFQCGFNTIAGRSYVVQASDDLGASWLTLTNFIANGGFWPLSVPFTASAARFFRVLEP